MGSTGYLDQQGLPLRAACPACAGGVPMKNAANGLSCPRCRGRVLDHADAGGLMRRLPQPPLPEPDPARRRVLSCPLCQGPMGSHRAAGVQVEICATCQATFFEPEAHRQVAMAVARAQALAAPAPSPLPAPRARAAASGAQGGPRIEPIAAPPGAGRLVFFKLLPLLVLGFVGWRNAGPLGRLVSAAGHGPAAITTTLDMGTARNALAAEFALSERWPSDLPAFLQAHLTSVNPHLDRWGTPYELRDEANEVALASCGPDRSCPTEDDLVVPLFRKKKPGQTDEAERIERALGN